ncbi:TFIIEalpha/SarR/Rpc3 HTH domain-containing protein [Cynara cardunculus var. scolymus]|uniref:TFIIEalpha/SarR/Rpc3 HTH domain-containing protein n=1 Tax=Cynara cardunculus var. scolymus TaxID=59895 RepID=A0A103XGD0_CYNCS|nr:TFIIEalpha/SarR/Rpc3 HTH domain-containing protein [Cynara cardunculus var. scolymus]
MSIEPFNKLVKLTARAFYDDITAKGDNQPKTGRSDNRGIAVVVLDALTRRQWVREEDLAKDLKLHLKQLRRTLRFFEEEKLVTRDHRKETAKGAKAYSAAVAATADNLTGRDGEEKIKLHTHSYCCLDYAQIHDVVRYRLHRMKKKLKDELDNKNTVQEYVCPKCGKRYNALDAIRLISFEDDSFHCESCNTELVAESDKLASQDIGDGDDNARRRRREKLRDMLQKMEVELKPLMDQLSRVKDLDAPDYGTLQAWELRASAAARASNADPGEIHVEVAFSGVEEKGEIKSESAPMKVLPPWMIKEGMNLTNEQRGGVKQESNMEGTSASIDMKDEKKLSSQEDDAKNLQASFNNQIASLFFTTYIILSSYYAALLQRQKEQEEATKREQDLSMNSVSTDVDPSNSRKRQRDDDGEGDVEWEETPTAGETFKVDLNVEAAEPSGDDEDDDGIDWEEG